MQNCKQCGFQFSLLSQRFFCCDQSQPVCSLCRRKACKKCQKPRSIEIIIPRCDKCYSRLYESDLLLEYSCERYFCSKCLSGIFIDAYQKVAIERKYQQKDGQLYVKLYCGHEYPYQDLLGFFQHFCLGCGRQYDSGLDYEFNDGVKLCFLCYRYFAQKFQSALIKCELCLQVIQNSTKASIIDNSDIAICQKCTQQSVIEEKIISESRKVIKDTVKEDKKHFDNNSFSKIEQFQTVQTYSPQVKQQPEVQQQPKVPKSPLTKLFKKPSISQLKKKQQKRSNSNKSNSASITSRFSNNFQDIDEQTSKALGLPPNIKLKKHLSNQTYVEHYAIDIPQNVTNDFVTCKRCNASVSSKLAYDLYHPSSKIGSKNSLVQFSSIKTASSLNNENSYHICRVCYNKSSQREKSILDISSSIKSHSAMSNRPSKLEDSSSNMDYLKVGKSSRRQNRSPSPSPNKQYSLTGSKQEIPAHDNKPHTKESLLNPNSYHDKVATEKQYTKKIVHPVSSETRHTTTHSNPQKFMKCDLCRDVKKSLIATINQGYLCEDCYYKKTSHYDSYFRR